MKTRRKNAYLTMERAKIDAYDGHLISTLSSRRRLRKDGGVEIYSEMEV